MKRVVLMLALALVIPALAMAANFSYYTTGVFGPGPCAGNNTCAFGSTTISFAGKANSVTPQPGIAPTTTDLGVFTISGGSTTPDTLSGSFSLNVFQVTPDSGNQAFVGNLTGTIQLDQSSGAWVFADLSATRLTFSGGSGLTTTYQLRNLDNCGGDPCIVLGYPTAGGAAQNTVTAFVTQVPEPASIMLFGSGLTGLAGLVRRRIKK
jgi:hypothetical protein